MEYFVQPTPRFEKELKKLVKKYPNADEDLELILEELENGNLLGDDITGLKLNGNKVFNLIPVLGEDCQVVLELFFML